MQKQKFIEYEIEKELARRKHLNFVRFTWDHTDSPFLEGYHTKIICQKIDEAIEKFRNGISSFYIISISHRHGKSELLSRTLPAHFLAEFPEKEVIFVTHTADSAYEFSQDGRKLISDNLKFAELYPDIKLAQDAKNVKTWRLDNKHGKSQYFGFKSGLSGKGGHLILIDDFFKNREDAESPVIQQKVISEFRSGIMTRIPHPSIVFMLATRWNLNDLIEECVKMSNDDPDFPQLTDENFITLPGVSDKYPSGYLFPEKYPPEWYRTQKAILTEYEYMSLMQCSPILKGGNQFDVTKINIIDKSQVPQRKQVIVIDLASSEQTKGNRDPDYTVCMRGTMIYDNLQPKIYITDVLRMRELATKRDKKIKNFILKYQNSVFMETFGAYKDTYILMKDALKGIAVINPLILSKSKTIKAEPLEAIFDAGNIFLVKSDWNQAFIDEHAIFDRGKHDDMVDCTAMLYHVFKRKTSITARNVIY